jgi:ribosomal protein S14
MITCGRRYSTTQATRQRTDSQFPHMVRSLMAPPDDYRQDRRCGLARIISRKWGFSLCRTWFIERSTCGSHPSAYTLTVPPSFGGRDCPGWPRNHRKSGASLSCISFMFRDSECDCILRQAPHDSSLLRQPGYYPAEQLDKYRMH